MIRSHVHDLSEIGQSIHLGFRRNETNCSVRCDKTFNKNLLDGWSLMVFAGKIVPILAKRTNFLLNGEESPQKEMKVLEKSACTSKLAENCHD